MRYAATNKGLKTNLTHAVIRQFNMTLTVEQHVVQFQVPIDDASVVEKIESRRDFGSVEARMFFRQAALSLHVEHQIAAVHKLNHEK